MVIGIHHYSEPGMPDPTAIIVNGRPHTIQAAPDTPLIYVLRNELGLNGPQFGCGLEQCGSCLVLLGRQPKHACRLTVAEVGGGRITTLEGLAEDGELHPVQAAFLEEQASQCGFCLNGMVLATAALLWRHPRPTDGQIREALNGQLCRCGAHLRVLRAVRRAASLLAEAGR
jgi:nicotinate dehydrogenase subunit A